MSTTRGSELPLTLCSSSPARRRRPRPSSASTPDGRRDPRGPGASRGCPPLLNLRMARATAEIAPFCAAAHPGRLAAARERDAAAPPHPPARTPAAGREGVPSATKACPLTPAKDHWSWTPGTARLPLLCLQKPATLFFLGLEGGGPASLSTSLCLARPHPPQFHPP
eukprot:scaffold2119_cov264-Pinguiococcus_pyrenoidosus.AAC.9